MIVYFSGTGNSAWCADFLSKELCVETFNTFDSIRNKTHLDLHSDDPWVFVVPTYAWRIPKIFEKLLCCSRFSGSRDAYFIMTCGGDIGAAEKHNKALCRKLGLIHKGTLEIVLPENYIALFDVPSEEVIARQFNEARSCLFRAAESIHNGLELEPTKKERSDGFKSGLINVLFYPTYVHNRKFRVTDSCVGCGACVSSCVCDCMDMVNGKPVWVKDDCTHCMACITTCPVEAIEYGDATIGKRRYRCEGY